jgi:hypothetical protein
MKRLGQILLLVVAGWFCAGCFPEVVTICPGTSGRVLDAETLGPIKGAQVAVTTTINNERPHMATKADGEFSIHPRHRLILYFPSGVRMPLTGKLEVGHAGYDSAVIQLTVDPNQASSLVADAPALAAKLKAGSDPLSVWLMGRFSESSRGVVMNYPGNGLSPDVLKGVLKKNLDAVIDGPLIYNSRRFDGVALKPQTRESLTYFDRVSGLGLSGAAYRDVYPSATTPETIRSMLNRRLLEDAYPEALSSRSFMPDSYRGDVGVILLSRNR